MRHRKKTPPCGKTVTLTVGAGRGMSIEFTGYFDRKEKLPCLADNSMDKRIRDALESSLSSSDPEIRKKAVRILVENAIKERKMYEIRRLLDLGGTISREVDEELDRISRENGKNPF